MVLLRQETVSRDRRDRQSSLPPQEADRFPGSVIHDIVGISLVYKVLRLPKTLIIQGNIFVLNEFYHKIKKEINYC